MALGERKCSRHPFHDANRCPHHGKPQEEPCGCAGQQAAFDPTFAAQQLSGAQRRELAGDAAVGLDMARDPSQFRVCMECLIVVDGVSFILSHEGASEGHAVQAAASKLKAATQSIGAVWS